MRIESRHEDYGEKDIEKTDGRCFKIDNQQKIFWLPLTCSSHQRSQQRVYRGC